MYVEYSEVMHRLRRERQRLGWTQTTLSRELHMSQCNYCKAELGKIKLSYFSLRNLIKAGFDLHQIYTGENFLHSKYRELFTGYSRDKLVFLAQAALPLIREQALALPRQEARIIQKRITCLKDFLHPAMQEYNILLRLRRHEKYTQRQMTELLGLDIKKYAALEKGWSVGDSEILLRIYNHFQLSPLLLLGDREGLACEMVSLLEGLRDRDGQRLYILLKNELEN